jgi:ABC-type multidrug transport system fused ATPase/permease subunit
MKTRIRQNHLIKGNALYRAVSILSRADINKLLLVSLIQISLGLFDLIGIAIFGVMGSLAVSGIQSQSPNSRVGQILDFLHLSDLPFQNQAAILAILATSFLVARTLLTVVIAKRTLLFLCRRGAAISAELISRLLSTSLLYIQKRTTQQLLYALTSGVNTITVGVISTLVTLISDLSLLLILSVGLFLVDPAIAISTFSVFGAIIFVMYKSLHSTAHELGKKESELQIKSSEKVVEVLLTYRESVVRNRRTHYANEIGILRFDLANVQARLGFMPYIGKYVIETTLVLGALLIAAVQFAIHDAVTAVATLSIFLVTGTRISPAALRLQQALMQIKGSLGGAEPTLQLIDELMSDTIMDNVEHSVNFEYKDFDPKLSLQDISFSYPKSDIPALSSINLKIESGSVVALVGPSGGGKTTLIDVLLGIIKPDTGSVQIAGLEPIEAIRKSPGAISYVPQDVAIIDGTIRQNVGMGFPPEFSTDIRVNTAIEIAGLMNFVSSLPNGLDTQVGERGTKISGGQRQRLGIARALFTNPKLLVLDEATSALDGESESQVTDAIMRLKGSVTVIMIAHRLSSIRNATQVIYIDKGEVLAEGSFDFVRGKIEGFDNQARLMGL